MQIIYFSFFSAGNRFSHLCETGTEMRVARRRRLISSRVNEKHTVTGRPLGSGWGLVCTPCRLMALGSPLRVSGGSSRLMLEPRFRGQATKKIKSRHAERRRVWEVLMRIWVWTATYVEPCGDWQWRPGVDLAVGSLNRNPPSTQQHYVRLGGATKQKAKIQHPLSWTSLFLFSRQDFFPSG